MSDLAIERDAVLRELQDRTNQTWLVKRKRWALLVLRQSEEIERLREHAVILAATAEQVERERCAKVCESTYPEWNPDEATFQKPCFDTPAECAAAIRGVG